MLLFKQYSTQLYSAAAAKSLQSCPILCDPIDGSPPGSPVPGILQARTLEWVAISFSNGWKWKVKVKSLSRVRLPATPWTAAHQAPLPMRFSRQEYWSGLPLPSPSYILDLYNKYILLSSHFCNCSHDLSGKYDLCVSDGINKSIFTDDCCALVYSYSLFPVTVVFTQVSLTIGTCLLGIHFACRLCLKIQLNKISYGYRTCSFHLLCIAYDRVSVNLHVFFLFSYTYQFLASVLQVNLSYC